MRHFLLTFTVVVVVVVVVMVGVCVPQTSKVLQIRDLCLSLRRKTGETWVQTHDPWSTRPH